MKAKSAKRGAEEEVIVGRVVEDDETPSVKPPKAAQKTSASGTTIVEEIPDPVELTGSLAGEDSPKTNIAAQLADVENVEVVFLQPLLDYPVIGRFNFLERFGIATVPKHAKFTVPRDVGLTLLDKGLVTIPGIG